MIAEKGLADVIKLRTLRQGDFPGISRGALRVLTCILIRGRFHIDLRGKVIVTMKAEIEVMQPQAKKRWQPLEAGTGKETNSPLQPPEETQPGQHLDFSPAILTLDFWPPEL